LRWRGRSFAFDVVVEPEQHADSEVSDKRRPHEVVIFAGIDDQHCRNAEPLQRRIHLLAVRDGHVPIDVAARYQRRRFYFCRRPSAGAGAQGWTRCKRARAHAEARAQWRRNVAQGIAAARAAAFLTKRPGSIGAQPVASRFALGIDALHGEAGQKLHIVFPQRPWRLCGEARSETRIPQ